jgi:hypothetical protein
MDERIEKGEKYEKIKDKEAAVEKEIEELERKE